MWTNGDQERSTALADWLRHQIGLRDSSATKIAQRSHNTVSRAQVDWLLKGVNQNGDPNRPAPRTLKAVARGLATNGLGQLDELLEEDFYHEMLACCGYLREDDPDALEELNDLINEAAAEGIVVAYGRAKGLPWTKGATQAVREQLEAHRRKRHQPRILDDSLALQR